MNKTLVPVVGNLGFLVIKWDFLLVHEMDPCYFLALVVLWLCLWCVCVVFYHWDVHGTW